MIRLYLVGGDWNMNFIFPYTGNNHPNWLSYFSDGWLNHQPDIYRFDAAKMHSAPEERPKTNFLGSLRHPDFHGRNPHKKWRGPTETPSNIDDAGQFINRRSPFLKAGSRAICRQSGMKRCQHVIQHMFWIVLDLFGTVHFTEGDSRSRFAWN